MLCTAKHDIATVQISSMIPHTDSFVNKVQGNMKQHTEGCEASLYGPEGMVDRKRRNGMEY